MGKPPVTIETRYVAWCALMKRMLPLAAYSELVRSVDLSTVVAEFKQREAEAADLQSLRRSRAR